jgi:Family of unknown function (DUF5947)
VTDTVSVLRRITSERPVRPPGERCEMCVAPIADEHSHVVDIRNRSLMCTCRPCALLFDRQGADLAFKTVPDRYLTFTDFRLSQGQWDDLAIPVGMAFFFSHSGLGKMVGFYPSPAGATESELPLEAWDGIVAANPMLATMSDDVEALLLRKHDDDVECFLVPIDACYELVGHLRKLWRGFDGGDEARERLELFFADIVARSKPA